MQKNTNRIRHIIHSVCCLAIVCIVCTGAVYDATGIDISIIEINEFEKTSNEYTIRARQSTAGEVLLEADKEIGLYDKLNVKSDDTVDNNDTIVIRRGVNITVSYDGTIESTSSTYSTVAEALVENGYFLGENDYTVPSADSTVTEGMNIDIVRVSFQNESRDEQTGFNTVYKDDNSIYEGTQRVQQEGRYGIIRVNESVVYENGQEISRTEVSRETISEPVDKVILNGTKKKTVTKNTTPAAKKSSASKAKSSSTASKVKVGNNFNYSKSLKMTATAYSAFTNGKYGTTASGMKAGYGVVAVDPNVISLGTKVYVEGYGYAIAADTGGAIKGNKIDLCFEKSNKELMAFGKKTVNVYILS